MADPISRKEAYEAWMALQREIERLRNTLNEIEQVSNTWLAYLEAPAGESNHG